MNDGSILLYVGGDTASQWLPVFAEHYPRETVLWYSDDLGDDALSGVEFAVVWAPGEALFARIPNVKALFSLGAGVDHITLSGVTLPDVPVVRYVNDDLTNAMGEWIVLQCLIHLRQHLAYAAQARAKQWRILDQPAAGDMRVGIMGLGVLGQDAAKKLLTMGFQVSGWSRTEKSVPGVEAFHGDDQLDAFLAQTDILVSLLPLTRETEGLIDKALLGKLARDGALGGPFLINGGRGKTQNDADIAACLAGGMLKGASLDVFQVEPLPPDHALWSAPNLVITPHAAAWSKRESVAHYVMGQIARLREGKPLQNVIDRERGY